MNTARIINLPPCFEKFEQQPTSFDFLLQKIDKKFEQVREDQNPDLILNHLLH